MRKLADDSRLELIQSNERLLGQIGQDLHDGPIQLLSILALKQSELFVDILSAEPSSTAKLAANLRHLTESILTELSNTAAGLVLLELDDLSVAETLHLAIRQHEDLTATTVLREFDDLPSDLSLVLRICLFRIVQEGLNNAYHYAHGRGQCVAASADLESITIAVSDYGPDTSEANSHLRQRTGLGVPGLRKRINALGGSFEIRSRTHGGTLLKATLPLDTRRDSLN